MNVDEQIANLFLEFGEQTAEDLKDSAIRALKEAGRKSPQDIALDFDATLSLEKGNVTVTLRAVRGSKAAFYWEAIDKGRKAGARNIPADVVGKKWQNENNIDPRKILNEIRRKKGLSVSKKPMNYDKAARALSFVIQKSIKKKGIKPKPYVDRVLSDGRIDVFREKLTPILGEKFKLIIKDLI